MDINRVSTGGIKSGDNAKAVSTGKKPSAAKFNPNAQVVSSDVAAGQAGKAKVLANTGEVQIEVEGVGLVSLNLEKLQGFTDRLKAGRAKFENYSIGVGREIGKLHRDAAIPAAYVLLAI